MSTQPWFGYNVLWSTNLMHLREVTSLYSENDTRLKYGSLLNCVRSELNVTQQFQSEF